MDPYYPVSAGGCIPGFQSIDEEAEFWDTHSIMDFPDAIDRISSCGIGEEVIIVDRVRGDDIRAYLAQFTDEEPS